MSEEPRTTSPPVADSGAKPNPAREIERRLDDAEAAMSHAQLDELMSNAVGSSQRAGDAVPFQLGDLKHDPTGDAAHTLELLSDVELDLRIELGRTRMKLEEVLHLRGGSVVALDKLAGDPVDVYVNGRLIAHGEVLVMNDNFCIRVTELVGGAEVAAAS